MPLLSDVGEIGGKVISSFRLNPSSFNSRFLMPGFHSLHLLGLPTLGIKLFYKKQYQSPVSLDSGNEIDRV